MNILLQKKIVVTVTNFLLYPKGPLFDRPMRHVICCTCRSNI